jgi:signal transduction histidine kinase
MHLARRAALAIDNARLYHEARDAVRLREEVLAVVSHDLKNPLGAIRLAATSLSAKVEDPRIRRQIDTVLRASGRMQTLIEDLLDIASMQAGRFKIEKHEHKICEIIEAAIEAHAPAAQEKGITLNAGLPNDLRVDVDRERVLQVLENLIGNAIKFSASDAAVVVTAMRQDDEVRVEVADTGPGIHQDDLVHIFEPYWSAQPHARKGTGLGLYISKGIIEAHGGRIWAESEVGIGTRMFFTLPLGR